MLTGYEFLEAAFMAKMCKVIKELQISQNGTYTAPPGTDGYSPIIVNVPDRYDEGYSDGENNVVSHIEPLTVTSNGVYNRCGDNFGYHPVTVNVPDRYDEGYTAGQTDGFIEGILRGVIPKTITANGTYDATVEYSNGYKGYNPVTVNVPGEYIFSSDTDYDDISDIVGDDATIDKTLGYGVSTETEINPNNPTRQTVRAIVVNINGTKIDNLYGMDVPVKDECKIKSIYVHNDGKVDITFLYNGNKIVYHAFSNYLVGFGESGNEIAARNRN